ncbi:MAG: undecaprenyldiphospho-muramoylpentapeptide beta-N-acetylglucosaminyltransferase [Cyclobacteriaceae bacterium]|nr:undecaprenyldiphospho-muramoylpentapeptide beta-N-acetylglucosaminyltransferase [Cyclobacteriaceae bacterium]
MTMKRPYRIMISGGGTGGHIFPAISIAQALQHLLGEVELLFVGAQGRMEMKKVPEAGFEIRGLWISGLQRKLTFDNLLFPVRVVYSIIQSRQLIRQFRPDVVVGVGGFASGPLLFTAAKMQVPTLIQEQNSYAGLTNKWLASRVRRICVAHDGMEKYFPARKIAVTGNPVRGGLKLGQEKREEAFRYFNLDPTIPTLLVIGGSLGARTLNESVLSGVGLLREAGIQVIWQTGGYYLEEMKQRTAGMDLSHVWLRDFISEMGFAYLAADVVISRAGALSLAELMLTGRPSVLVPSPNVAEDHQTKNAMALVERKAAVMIVDKEAGEKLVATAIALLSDRAQQKILRENIAAMAHPHAAIDIAKEVIGLVA